MNHNGKERRRIIHNNPYRKRNNKAVHNDNQYESRADPVLEHILRQLRPFQREAYDFCTQGILPNRSCTNLQDVKENTSSAGYSTTNRNHIKNVKPESTEPPRQRPMMIQYKNPDLIGKGRILLADEMGLGKTVTSLAIMAHYRTTDWPLLILCPASLRYTWPGEIEKFMPSLPASSIYVVQGFDDADFYENETKRKKIQIVVATYSLLQTRSAAAKTLEQFQFKSVIVDESHNLKQRNTQRSKLALPILERAKRLLLLSGTPALARPVELWTQISTLAPGLFADNYTQFTKQYCNARRGRFGWDVNGLSNADELHAKLQQIMVRRLKADVLDELPPKQRTIVKINVPKGEKRKECESILKDLVDTRQSLQDLVGDAADGANFEARSLLMQAYQASGIAKSSGVVEYLLEWLRGSGTQKVLIFAHHKGVLDALEVAVSKEYKATAHIRIDGSVSSLERAARVRKFQTSSKIRVAILSITAAGVGLTLTAATTVMFAELHWTPGVLAQAEDRCHRIGQRNAVNILYLICQDGSISVDPQLWKMLARKIGTLGKVIDGEKNASMNAKEAPAANGMPNNHKRQSVQDELQSFFAETSPNDTSAAVSKVPIKGTIMSFFKKQTEVAKKEPMTKNNPTMPKEVSSSPFVHSVKKYIETASPKQFMTTSLALERSVEWACEKCTYMNSQLRAKSGWLKCSICGATHFENKKCSPTVTPTNTQSSQEDPIVLDDSDDGETEPEAEPSTLNSLWNPKKRIQAKRSDRDVVVLDSDQDYQNHKQGKDCPNVVCLVADEEQPESLPLRKKRKVGAQDIIFLDETDGSAKSRVQVQPTEFSSSSTLLCFSVSKNSGRFTIHFASTNESSLINFSLEQVLTEETASRLLDTTIHRRSSSKPGIQLQFDMSAINQIISKLEVSIEVKGLSRRESLMSEIKKFVSSFQALREVEKQAIKDSGKSFSPHALKQAASKLIVSSGEKSIERYAGGAKERARERLESGIAEEKDKAILEGRLCAWCGGQLPRASRLAGVESTYCSRECAEQGRLKRGGMFASSRIREQVFALEGGICRICGINGHAVYTRVAALHPAERLNALINANWRLPKTAKALDRLLQNPKEGDFWQADHIKAVSEGGGGCGLENLRTLCVPCHSEETEKLRGRLKLSGGSKSSSDVSRGQKDIRSMFGVKK